MSSRLEKEIPFSLKIAPTGHIALDHSRPLEDKTDSKKLPPHGVDPATYSFLLAAIDYNRTVKNIFDKIDPTTRNLIGIYYGNEVSLREAASLVGWSRKTCINSKNRILKGLVLIWEQLPPEIQEAYPKEEVIKIKENITSSLRLKQKKRDAMATLWKKERYRTNVIQGMKGKTHTPERIQKIRKRTQEVWAVIRFLKDTLGIDITQRTDQGKRLYQDYLRIVGPVIYQAISFLNELQENPYGLVRRRVLEQDIKVIGSTVTNDIQSIFSSLSTDELKKRATELEDRLETLKNQLKARRAHRIETQIGTAEMSMWQQVKNGNLMDKIVQTGAVTKEQLNMIGDYWEKKIIRKGLTVGTFDGFTTGLAKLVAAGEIP